MEKLEKLYEGKAKILHKTSDPDLLIQYFKDDASAFDGKKKGTIVDKGVMNNHMSSRIFEYLEEHGVKTHYVKTLNDREMLVKNLDIIPVEVVLRNVAAGSLCKRLVLAQDQVRRQKAERNLQRAQTRLAIVVPLVLLLVFVLLFFSLKRMRDVLIIYSGIPLAAVGAILALWLRGIPFSVSAAVGFIALTGIAVLNGQILIEAIREQIAAGSPVAAGVIEAAKTRLRPVLATGVTDAVGFFPMAISTGVGSEVQRPLATVVIGGIVTSTLLTLVVLPALYATFGDGRSSTTVDDDPVDDGDGTETQEHPSVLENA